MITYVNGYVCTTPCEAAAAKKGHDPFAPPGTPPGQNGKADKAQSIDGQPAVSFGGVLANLNQINTVTPAGALSSPAQSTFNLLV